MDLKEGQLFDEKYKILNILGKGGMGKVYLAQNVKLGTLWAIKQVNKDPNSPVDFLAEPNIMKKLNHPSLPRIFDIIENNECIYIILDYVEGVSLDIELKKVGTFSEDVVVNWAKQICDVYIYLHELKPHPIIYRDMKPSNLMKLPDGSVKVIDFGIAREYKAESESDTQLLGTPGYAAPEQKGLSQTSERSDIFSLGVTLYHLVTGLGPREILEFKPIREINPSLSEGLEEILIKMLKAEPSERYQTARELLDDLVNIEKKSNAYRRARRKRTIKTVSAVTSLCLFSYLTMAGFSQMKAETRDAYDQLVNDGYQFTDNYQFAEANAEFKEAIQKLPEELAAYTGTVRNLYMQGSYQEAIAEVERILQDVESASSDPNLYYLLGSSYYEIEDYQKAAGYFQKASTMAPNEVMYLRDLAVALAKEGKQEEAEATLNDIIAKKMDEEITWYVSGEIAGAQDEIEKAIEQFEKVLNDGKDPYLKAKSSLASAQLYKANKKRLQDESIDKRLEVLDKGLEQSVSNFDLMLTEMQAEAYHEKAMYEDDNQELYLASIEKFQSLLDRGYERPYLYKNIAIIYQKMDAFDKAEETLNRMKEKYPTDYSVYYQLAMLYADMENKKSNSERNYVKTIENYELALHYSTEGKSTAELQPLINLIEELRANNFIE